MSSPANLPAGTSADRRRTVGRVLETIVELTRQLQPAAATPFDGVELTRTQLEALFLLAHRRDLTPGRLATALHLTRGAVTQLLAPLREGGLIDSVPHPQDARSVIITLTPQARTQVTRFEDTFLTAVMPRFAALTDQNLQDLTELLHALLEDE